MHFYLSLNYFGKSIKNYKKILDGILILNLIVSVIHAIVSIIVINLYKNHNLSLNQRNLRIGLKDFNFYIPCLIAILSFFLYFIISKSISTKIPDHKFREIFNSFKSLNNISFFLFILIYIPDLIYFIIWLIIFVLGVYFTKFSKLRKKKINKILKRYVSLGFVLFIIGGVYSIFYQWVRIVKLGPAISIIGLTLMNMKVYTHFYNENLEIMINEDIIYKNISRHKLLSQIGEKNIEQINESKYQPEFIIKEEFSQIDHKTAVLNTATETEINNLPQKTDTKKLGITNIRKSLKLLSKKPIQNKIKIKEDISQVSKKKCPFCGKEHDDLNTPFCHACGYKF